jgi:hypothetical protein
MQPKSGSQDSMPLQNSPSSQSGGAPPTQVPPAHVSFVVHASPSSHEAVLLVFTPSGGNDCIGGHSRGQGSRAGVVHADGSGGHHFMGNALTNNYCVLCYEMSRHKQGTVRLWLDPNNPTTPLPVSGYPDELVPFCSNCHDALTHPIIHTTGASWETACTACHELLDPSNTNLSLVNDVIHNQTLDNYLPVVFESRTGPNSFSDGDPLRNDGICQVCHTATAYHLYDGTATPHNDGTNCTICRQHLDGFPSPVLLD